MEPTFYEDLSVNMNQQMRKNLTLEFDEKRDKTQSGSYDLSTPDVVQVVDLLMSERTPEEPKLVFSGVAGAKEMYVRGFEKALSKLWSDSKEGFVEMSRDSSTSDYFDLDSYPAALGCGVPGGSKDGDQPATVTEKPTTFGHQLDTATKKPTTFGHQPMTVPHQETTATHRPITFGHQPMTVLHQATATHRPITFDHQPMTVPHQATANQRPITFGRLETTATRQPMTFGHQPKTTTHHQTPKVQLQDDLQTVPDVPSSPPTSPIDMDSQELQKRERKRLRNREAAKKCRQRKLEKIARLEEQVGTLQSGNAELASVVSKLKEEVRGLKERVKRHRQSGCKIPYTQAEKAQRRGF